MKLNLVTGPPCNGGVEYALARMDSEDAIIDLEGLTFALHSRSLAEQVMERAISLAVKSNQTAWVVSHDPKAEWKIPSVSSTCIDPGELVCLQNAQTGEEREAIKTWYEERSKVALPKKQGIQW